MDLKLYFQIAREMVISPQNAKLGLTQLVKKIGMVDLPDNPDGELIKYRVYPFITDWYFPICIDLSRSLCLIAFFSVS